MTPLEWILVFGIGHHYLSLFHHSFFLHRYCTHRQFSMNKVWERIFWFNTWLIQGSSYLDARSYVVMHLAHHEFSDTEKDPHSPRFSKDAWKMMLKTINIFKEIKKCKHWLWEMFKQRKFPKWEHFEEFSRSNTSRAIFIALYITIYVFFCPVWWLWPLLLFNLLTGPVQGAIVNWCGHKYGYRNFNTPDNSKNTLFWDLFLLGELYQNNHHNNPESSNFAYGKWYEIDPLYPVIKSLSWLKIIKLKPVVA